jgi:glyoxalase family protein
MQPIQGIHHITAVAGDPQRNVDFYVQVLGQRFVKKTVNFDDPGTYHLYYGDLVGSPGTIMTFFPWRMARRGRRGNGEVSASAYNILPTSFDFWWKRLSSLGVAALTRDTRFGSDVIGFHDPDGMRIELITHSGDSAPRVWEGGPVPAEHALRAFHGVTIGVDDPNQTAALLLHHMGYTLVGEEGMRVRFKGASDDHGQFVDLVVQPGLGYGQLGSGSVHHVAFRTVDDSEQLEYKDALTAVGLGPTPVQDRQYFHSIYFREPSGTLFEVATDAPGFAWDEPVESLGRELKLPPWLEAQRPMVEARLPTLVNPEYAAAE